MLQGFGLLFQDSRFIGLGVTSVRKACSEAAFALGFRVSFSLYGLELKFCHGRTLLYNVANKS